MADPTKTDFEHRPFSLTVNHVGDPPMVIDIGDVHLQLFLKIPPDQREAFRRKLDERGPDEWVIIYIEGIQK